MMKLRIAKMISILSVAPIIAFVLMTTLYFIPDNQFQDFSQYILSVIFLTVLPILAYPLQKVLPKYKNMGREGQRDLAFIMVIVGYSLGLFFSILLNTPSQYITIYLGYFLSGFGLIILNKLIKVRASGHACGIMGPIVISICFLGNYYILLLLLIPLVFWSRLTLHRHTLMELISGAYVSLFCTLLSISIFYV